MLYFPDWSDLAKVSNEMRNAWETEVSLREIYRSYFDGDIFRRPVDVELPQDEEPPLEFPVGINLVRMLCTAQADAAFGEWSDQVISFEVRRDEAADDASKAAASLLSDILYGSNGNSLLWELELDRNIFGGAAMKITPNLPSLGHIKWSRVPTQNFFPIWDPDDDNELLEVYALTMMSQEQALAKYGLTSTAEIVWRVEHWTREKYTNHIDGQEISALSGVNPWGVVPFVYIPRMRTTSWWGDALSADVTRCQDELNRRVADMGDSINYNAHPVYWGYNLPRNFNAKNYPLGPNAMWDMGRVLGSSPPPSVALLEAKAPIPQGAFDYVQFLYDWSRTSSFSPPITFGEDSGGGQRSGVTLEIRMWPLIKALKRSSAYMVEAVSRAARISSKILAQKSISDVPARALDRINKSVVVPVIAPVLPRDHQTVVDEVVKLFSTEPKGISLETAQKELGRGPGEVDRIKAMMGDETLIPPAPPKPNDVKEGLAGKMQPQERKTA
ncbi:MAG: phage portal protein [Anaerolineaceae bacterium]|jgi:hypothetical protein